MIPAISALASLAGAIISIFSRLEQSKQSGLDREAQRELQQAQHAHERALLDMKRSASVATYSKQGNPLFDRLWIEGNGLSNLGYEVVFEPVGDGYGLALLVDSETTLCVWVPPNYPSAVPRVLLKTSDNIDEIDFEDGAWRPEIFISDIIGAFVADT